MKFSSVIPYATLVAAVAAAPSAINHVLHEKREGTSFTFVKSGAADRAAIVPVRIGLTQSNLENGHDLLMDVSSPESPKYAQHYTEQEIHDLFAPSEETVSTVHDWLVSAGISADKIGHSLNKQWLQLDMALGELEDLIKTKYHLFEHKNGDTHLACDEYSVPEHVTAHIDYITPGIRHMPLAEHHQKRSIAKRSNNHYRRPILMDPAPVTSMSAEGLGLCSAIASPACIRRMYNITLGTTNVTGNKLGIFEDIGDHYSQTDLNDFYAAVDPRIPQGTAPELRAVDGAIGPVPVSQAGPESDLDFQISMPILYPQTTVLFQTDDEVYENNYTYVGFFNHLLEAIDGSYCETKSPYDPPYPNPAPGGYKKPRMCGFYEPTNVLSFSYGGGEIDVPLRYFKRQCNEYMKLGMQGISVVVSSGDYGVAEFPGAGSDNGCLVPGAMFTNAPDPSGVNGTVFHPDFPSSCPYVTTLGSTFLPAGADVTKDEEVATTRFPSGGGFSNYFATPDYQKSAVQGYLTKYPPPYKAYQTVNGKNIGVNGGIFNSAGRAFPDFAAVGDNVLIYNLGRPRTIGGTSASAPAFAAILTRINEERINSGKKPIGFVNPTLYAHPEVFHDITVGNNPGCGTNGFNATPGWDPVTGLGTPNYPKMLKLFQSLP